METPAGLDSVDAEILRMVEEYAPTTLSELARTAGWSKSMLWRRLRKLAALGLVELSKRGGALIVRPREPSTPPPTVKVGILRASEYPYILPLASRLRGMFHRVDLIVYDEARLLALDLAAGRVHLAMAPLATLLLAHRLSAGRLHVVGGGSAGGAYLVRNPEGLGGHATTMASSMELCAELHGLPGGRVYARSGEEIAALLAGGRVEWGAVWQPYADRLARLGLEVEDCGLPVCCVLGAHASLEPLYPRISRAMAESVADARRGAWDPAAYSRLTGIPVEEVRRTVASYEFLDEPPADVARRIWGHLARAALPPASLGHAFPLNG
ncbi:MAG: helix-turn-helix domain-containing protein [Desulfurococcales archaeon]|nr:helix-turn-helix domain-containing protein [Desulfurococcales archaeon]